MNYYQEQIRKLAPGHDPRHIEAYMRLEHDALDGLSAAQFRREVRIAVECIRAGGLANAESLALSMGLLPPREDR